MPNLGSTELIIILVIVVLIFGVGKLPQLGRGLGQSIREFRSSLAGGGVEEKEDETRGEKEEDETQEEREKESAA